MEMLQGVWKQHLRPRAAVGYGVKIFVPSPPNYVTRSPGVLALCFMIYIDTEATADCHTEYRLLFSCSFFHFIIIGISKSLHRGKTINQA